jgi:hypothetical protein
MTGLERGFDLEGHHSAFRLANRYALRGLGRASHRSAILHMMRKNAHKKRGRIPIYFDRDAP